MDIEVLTENVVTFEDAEKVIDEWFSMLDSAVRPQWEYFISDVVYRHPLIECTDSFLNHKIEDYWCKCLSTRIDKESNIHALKLADAAARVGKNVFFSDKLWYLGKIPFSNQGSHVIAELIEKTIMELTTPAKKLLILDMDNTLWGGILGELGALGIKLSDETIGAVFKKVQRLIKAMTTQGVLLALCSKNNLTDVTEVWDKNPHMLLKKEDFTSVKVNWNDKADNIREIAEELNLGIDSFVFVDDAATERENIRQRLPEVVVPEFPKDIEKYPEFIQDIYARYFRKNQNNGGRCR